MKRVLQVPLLSLPEQDVEVPAGAQVLHLAEKNQRVRLWLLVDPTAPLERWQISAVGDVSQVADESEYLGTAITYDGYVWHFFRDIGTSEEGQ